MDGDMNDIFQKLNTILEDPSMADNLKNIVNNFSNSNNDTNSSSKNCNQQQDKSDNCNRSNQTSPEFDINTILKIKKIMDSMNNNQNDPRSNLLCSLKPYLTEQKKEKIDQYIKFLNIAKVIEVINPIGGDLKNE